MEFGKRTLIMFEIIFIMFEIIFIIGFAVAYVCLSYSVLSSLGKELRIYFFEKKISETGH